MRCVFLGLDQPAIESAISRLIEEHSRQAWLDLSQVTVVVPGRRAGRRLSQRLVEVTASRSIACLPPRVVPIGALPELLYESPNAIVTDEQRQFAWFGSFQQLSPSCRDLLLDASDQEPTSSGSSADTSALLWQTQRIVRLHASVTAEGLRFADVVKRISANESQEDYLRWTALAEWEDCYEATLRAMRCEDRHLLRLDAVARGTCQYQGSLVLLGTADLPPLWKTMLKGCGADFVAYVFAPSEWQDRFDEFGCVKPPEWSSASIDIKDELFTVVRGPHDAAEFAARLAGQIPSRDLAIGVGDSSLVPYLKRSLEEHGLQARWAAGQPLTNTSIGRLLLFWQECLRSQRVLDLAHWSRHPLVDQWLRSHGLADDYLSVLDAYLATALPAKEVTATSKHVPSLVAKWWKHIAALRDCCGTAVGSLADHVDRFVEQLTALTRSAAAANCEDSDATNWEALEPVVQLAVAVRQVPTHLLPHWSPLESMEWLMDQLSCTTITPPRDESAIELLGWLELLLDDAPSVIVTGFHEGAIPSRSGVLPSLPACLQSADGASEDEQRVARESYILTTLLQTRRPVHLFVQRVGTDEEPLNPSRLLFRCEPAEMARRWQRVLHDVWEVKESNRSGDECVDRTLFTVPRVQPYIKKVDTIRVTDFRVYLACRYRFFLERVLQLGSVEDAPQEMQAAQFGDLAHRVLAEFGMSDQKDATDPAAITEFLLDMLSAEAARMFDHIDRAVVRLQLAQLATRFKYLAAQQATHAQKGWSIIVVEQPTDRKGVPFIVDGKAIGLVGRMDRVDRHRESGDLLIVDYKTSESGHSPRKQHQNQKGDWVDVQLPMYRHLARGMGLDGPISLSYFNLPKSHADGGIKIAKWTEEELAKADEKARQVVREIRKGLFWPPADPAPDFSEAWSWICLDGIREREPLI